MTITSDRPAHLYDRLEDQIMQRDQPGAQDTLFDLLRAERPQTEILRETIKVHAPYTHVPYHQRIDDGVVRFVNNDHCLLSARATLNLPRLVPEHLRNLPIAQTLWYVPSGLDIWNQLLGHMPGHYSRSKYDPEQHDEVPQPVAHWDQQDPLKLEGSFDERLNEWLSLVQRGEVDRAYRVFLGLFEEEEHRPKLLAQLVFTGLIDVQDRMLFNRSYTTGHKSYRARATVELGNAIGWDDAESVLYAGIPDIAVGPRWHSAYEMACQVALYELEELAPSSSLDLTQHSEMDSRLFQSDAPLTPAESESLIRSIMFEEEPSYLEQITNLLKSGRGPRQILDTIQIASSRVILQCGFPDAFSMPQHGYEYTNTLRWFYDNFDHPHRIKLLYVAGSFIQQCAHWVRSTPGNGQPVIHAPKGAEDLSRDQILENLDDALMTLRKEDGVAWTQAYLDAGYQRDPLVRTIAGAAVKHGNDPHNQEIGLCLMEDYLHSTSPQRESLLLAGAQHTAGHRKYGDSTESFRRFADAFDIPTNVTPQGANAESGDITEMLLDEIEIESVTPAQ